MKPINLKIAALVIAGIGLLALARATAFETAPEGVHNTGLLQAQMLWAQFASTMLLVGAVLFAGNHIAEAREAKANLEVR